MATCKIEHLQNVRKTVLEPREVDGSETFWQMFYFTRNHCLSHVTYNGITTSCTFI